jgi:hypothetical protein
MEIMIKSAQLIIFNVTFGFVYFAIEKTGLFSASPPTSLEVFYSRPVLVFSVVLLVIAIIAAIKNFRTLGVKGWMLVISVFLMVSGLWVSYFTRFSVEVILTEGQSFVPGRDEYVRGSLYRGRFAKLPVFRVRLEELSPEFSEDSRSITGLRGKFIYFEKDSRNPEDFVISDRLPKLFDNIFFKIRDFGYSPRYSLKTKEGRMLDSSFIYMNLFPEGSEDFFRLFSPLTYYVRYYSHHDKPEKEPSLKVRIVRNKAIVVNRDVRIGEEISFENARISFEEVRKWTKLSIKCDWGEIIGISGMIIAASCLVFMFFSMVKRRKINNISVLKRERSS